MAARCWWSVHKQCEQVPTGHIGFSFLFVSKSCLRTSVSVGSAAIPKTGDRTILAYDCFPKSFETYKINSICIFDIKLASGRGAAALASEL